MNILKTIAGLLFLVLLHSSAAHCQMVRSDESGQKEQVALLPFQVAGFSPEEGTLLTERFGSALGESGRFRVLSGEALRHVLADAGLTRIDSCTTIPCLTQVGVLLHAGKVAQVTAERWGQRCVLDMQIVSSPEGRLLYSERTDFTGPFDDLLAQVVPEQGRRMSQAFLDKKPNWYLIIAGVLVGVGLIFWIYTALGRRSTIRTKESSPMHPRL